MFVEQRNGMHASRARVPGKGWQRVPTGPGASALPGSGRSLRRRHDAVQAVRFAPGFPGMGIRWIHQQIDTARRDTAESNIMSAVLPTRALAGRRSWKRRRSLWPWVAGRPNGRRVLCSSCWRNSNRSRPVRRLLESAALPSLGCENRTAGLNTPSVPAAARPHPSRGRGSTRSTAAPSAPRRWSCRFRAAPRGRSARADGHRPGSTPRAG